MDNLFIQIGNTEKLVSAGFAIQHLYDGGHSVSDLRVAHADRDGPESSGYPITRKLCCLRSSHRCHVHSGEGRAAGQTQLSCAAYL